MEIINISKHQFRKMNEYKPNNEINNMECSLYLLKNKNKWNAHYKLFKKFNSNSGQYFSNKLYTINELINNRDNIDLDQIVLPDNLVTIDNEVVGYYMDFISPNICISKLLSSNSISFEFKIKILKEIGALLEKIKNNGIFALSDIHEGNFVYNCNKHKLFAIDVDSVKIGKNDASISKYLTFNPNLWNYPYKYPLNEAAIHIPNVNTTYLSYIYMILNFISGCNYINRLSVDNYYNYLQRLRDFKYEKELIDIFGRIYLNCENENPFYLLDTIPKNNEKINCRGLLR